MPLHFPYNRACGVCACARACVDRAPGEYYILSLASHEPGEPHQFFYQEVGLLARPSYCNVCTLIMTGPRTGTLHCAPISIHIVNLGGLVRDAHFHTFERRNVLLKYSLSLPLPGLPFARSLSLAWDFLFFSGVASQTLRLVLDFCARRRRGALLRRLRLRVPRKVHPARRSQLQTHLHPAPCYAQREQQLGCGCTRRRSCGLVNLCRRCCSSAYRRSSTHGALVLVPRGKRSASGGRRRERQFVGGAQRRGRGRRRGG